MAPYIFYRKYTLLILLLLAGCVSKTPSGTEGDVTYGDRSISGTTSGTTTTPSRRLQAGNALSFANAPGMYCNARVIAREDRQHVYLELGVARLAAASRPDDIAISYEIYTAGPTPQLIRQDSVALAGQPVKKSGNMFLIHFELLSTQLEEATMALRVKDMQNGKTMTELVPVGSKHVSSLMLAPFPAEEPLDYVPENDTVRFLDTHNLPVYVYRLREEFSPAPPPMSTLPPKVEAELKVDSLLVIPANTPFRLSTRALYLAQTDTTLSDGLGFRVVDKNFPRYKNVDMLIAPLIYVSTPEELSQLYAASDKKAALDNYWLRLTNDADKARQMIKLFYQRVEQANRLFTNYREGWKTDMGMIYIVFGEPDEILKGHEGQTWVYRFSNRGQETKFTFLKRSNQFSTSDYRLIRNPRYKDVWYETIAHWRGEDRTPAFNR